MKIAINFLLTKLNRHFISMINLQMCSPFGNVHGGFVLEAVIFLKFIMCHLDL